MAELDNLRDLGTVGALGVQYGVGEPLGVPDEETAWLSIRRGTRQNYRVVTQSVTCFDVWNAPKERITDTPRRGSTHASGHRTPYVLSRLRRSTDLPRRLGLLSMLWIGEEDWERESRKRTLHRAR